MPTPLFETPHCDDCRAEVADASELVTIPDGTDRPLRLCRACAAECEPSAYCPHCGSDRVVIDDFHFAAEAQTGYTDSGPIYVCRACRAVGDPEELEYRPVLEPAVAQPARIEPARETRDGEQERSA